MKLCTHCLHIQLPKGNNSLAWIGEYSLCGKGMKTNPVTGECDLPTQSSKYCSTLRQSGKAGDCGGDAQFFVPADARQRRADFLMSLVCDDCEQPTNWPHAVQTDPWGRPTGDVWCENCAEKRWDAHQERLMEDQP